jgi:cytochrome c-type biogenesis protein
VLPLVPSYLISIAGVSNGAQENGSFRRGMLTHAVVFVFGFSTVFVVLGISSSFVGHFLFTYQVYISRLGGIFLIIMGLLA